MVTWQYLDTWWNEETSKDTGQSSDTSVKHWGPNFKIKMHVWTANVSFFIPAVLGFVPEGAIGKYLALDEQMAWLRTGNKSLPESMMPHFTYTCVS